MARDIVIRNAGAADAASISALHTAAFGGPVEARLVAALHNSPDAIFSRVAEARDVVAGHVLLSRLNTPPRSLALAPLAVLPTMQGSGIGSLLVIDSLELAANACWHAIFVLGDPRYYRRFGFSAEAALGYECKYAGPHFMAKVLRSPPPGPREVVYPAAFDASA